MTSKQWLVRLMSISALLLIIIAVIAYIVDPFMQYRARDNSYILSSRYVNAGIIKNHDYDTVVVGSSMIQNFKMQSFRDKLNVNPIKATIGSISSSDIDTMLNLVYKRGTAETIYYEIDLTRYLSSLETGTKRLPDFLYDDNKFNDYKYLLGYESWMRFIPVDLAFNAIRSLNYTLPESFRRSMSIDYIEDWSEDYTFGEDKVRALYSSMNSYKMSLNIDLLKANVDESLYNLKPELEYVFFFPPYSAVYWHLAKENGTFDTYQELKLYISDKLSSYENVKIYDFHIMPVICELDYFMDTRHYNASVNEMMVDCFASGEYLADSAIISKNTDILDSMLEQFYNENIDWLRPVA